MEEKKENLMTEKEYKDKLAKAREEYKAKIVDDFNKGILHIFNFSGVSKFRSVRRAIKRGKVDIFTGIVYPARLFNNRKPTPGRRFNKSKKDIYGRLTRKVG